MELMNPYDLKPHPRNGEFFDDMDGQKWKDFLQSVRTSGIIEPIIVTQDLVIVSGHQRVRAAKAIGILKIAVEVRHYADDDKVLKDLIETNIMQRGLGNTNPVKLAKCIAELERILGIRNGSANEKGNNRIGDLHNANDKVTQADLAEKLKVSQSQLSRYKKLLDLVPELQTAVEDGKISATNASAILAKLPESEQKAIAEQIVGSDGKVSKQELEFYKNRVKELSDQNKALSDRKPEVVEKVVEKVVETVPSDYENLKRDNARLFKEKQELANKNVKQESEIRELKKAKGLAEEKPNDKATVFAYRVKKFLEENANVVWTSSELSELEKPVANNFRKAVLALNGYAQTLLANIGEEVNGV